MLPFYVLYLDLLDDGLVHVSGVYFDDVRLQVLLQVVHVHVVLLDLLAKHRQDLIVTLVQLQLH